MKKIYSSQLKSQVSKIEKSEFLSSENNNNMRVCASDLIYRLNNKTLTQLDDIHNILLGY